MLSQPKLAKQTKIHPARLRAIAATTNPKEASLDELVALAAAVADIPEIFALEGFEPLDSYPRLVAAVADIRVKLRALENRTISRDDVETIVRAVRRSAATSPKPQSERGRGRPKKGA